LGRADWSRGKQPTIRIYWEKCTSGPVHRTWGRDTYLIKTKKICGEMGKKKEKSGEWKPRFYEGVDVFRGL